MFGFSKPPLGRTMALVLFASLNLIGNPAIATARKMDSALALADASIAGWSLSAAAGTISPLTADTPTSLSHSPALTSDGSIEESDTEEFHPTPSATTKDAFPHGSNAPKLAIDNPGRRGLYREPRLYRAETPGDIMPLEIAFHTLNVMDAASTIACLRRDDCHERNPIYGRNPKPVMIIGAKAITSGVHYWVMRTLLPDHPGLARAFGWVTVTIQGSVVGLNLSQMF